MESRWFVWIAVTVCMAGAAPSDRKNELKRARTESPLIEAGYPELFTKKTSRLLSEALHMLNRVKDVQERRWLESFVNRLAILAQELEHNEKLNGKGNKTAADLVEFSKSLVENADQLKEFVVRVEAERNSPRQPVNKVLKDRHDDELVSQLRGHRPSEEDQEEKMLKSNKTPKVSEKDVKIEEHRQNKLRLEKMKEAEKKKILKEIYALSQKLKELGGETRSVVDVIKRSRGGVEIGTGHHFWEGAHTRAPTGSSTLPPSAGGQLREASNSQQAARTTASASVISKDEPSSEEDSHETRESVDEETNDDLVKQLEDEKMLLVTDQPSRSMIQT